MSYFKKCENGIILNVYVLPGAKSQEITGIHEERVKIRIPAQPIENQANTQVVAYLATIFGLSKSKLQIIRGEKSRKKDIFIPVSVDTLMAVLVKCGCTTCI